jgi:hypothetical protein
LGRLLGEPEGRAYFHDFLSSVHLFSTTFASNALMMAFAEGQRSVGVRLAADLEEANPDGWLLMLKEARNERQPGDDYERSGGATDGDEC